MESNRVFAYAAVMRYMSDYSNHWRSEQSLSEFLSEQKTVAISGVDTRFLTNHLRENGTCSACVVAAEADINVIEKRALALAQSFAGLNGRDLASEVTTDQPYQWEEGTCSLQALLPASVSPRGPHVVVLDYGVKRQMLRLLVDQGCRVSVVPATTKFEAVMGMKPDGVLLSNGPGDPAACASMIDVIKELIQVKMPLFGICLGHQLLALALGAKTKKMDFGHHGANHPVQDFTLGSSVISSQNHGFVVDAESLPKHFTLTQQSLFDGTIQGFQHQNYPIMSVQGHPEASPGPHDWQGLFALFVKMMEEHCA